MPMQAKQAAMQTSEQCGTWMNLYPIDKQFDTTDTSVT
jgi:hypothetical protein